MSYLLTSYPQENRLPEIFAFKMNLLSTISGSPLHRTILPSEHKISIYTTAVCYHVGLKVYCRDFEFCLLVFGLNSRFLIPHWVRDLNLNKKNLNHSKNVLSKIIHTAVVYMNLFNYNQRQFWLFYSIKILNLLFLVTISVFYFTS